jgi:hypothetical protein
VIPLVAVEPLHVVLIVTEPVPGLNLDLLAVYE